MDTLPSSKVGVVYDLRMNLHKPTRKQSERPSRLTSIISRLEKHQLLHKCDILTLCED